METKTIHATSIDELHITCKCPYKRKVCLFKNHVWRNNGDRTNRVIMDKSASLCDGLKIDGYDSVNIVVDENTKKKRTKIPRSNWAF